MSILKDALRELKGHAFYAKIFLDGEYTGVHVDFHPIRGMTIRGLKPPMPASIRVPVSGGHIFIEKSANSEWKEIKSYKDILELELPGIYSAYLFDPRTFEPLESRWPLDGSKQATAPFDSSDSYEYVQPLDEGQQMVFVRYDVEKVLAPFDVPKEEVKWIITNEGQNNEVRFVLKGGHLSEMLVREPASSEWNITLRFSF